MVIIAYYADKIIGITGQALVLDTVILKTLYSLESFAQVTSPCVYGSVEGRSGQSRVEKPLQNHSKFTQMTGAPHKPSPVTPMMIS